MAVSLLSIFSFKTLLSFISLTNKCLQFLGPNNLSLVAPFLLFKLISDSFTGLTVRGRGKGDDEMGNVTGPRGRYCRGLHDSDGRRRRQRRRRRRRLRRTLASPYVCVTRCARGVA